MNNFTNIRLLLIDEISLEGLDGITLQTLWIRISQVTNTNLPFPEPLERQYWNIIRKNPDFSFYELPEPRPDYVHFDRFLYIDSEIDIAYSEPEDIPQDIYIHKVVNDPIKGVKGSCPTYFQRKDITEKARSIEYEEAKRWGNKLVIVASQELREHAIIGTQVSNCIELSPIQYCVLERIGRARFQGEVTQGKRSLQLIGEDPKSLFYHRKTLLKFKLITKQVYYQKSGTQNYSGSLLHLQRFYTERKPKQLIITEQIVEFLKTKPNYLAQYPEVTAQVNIYKPLKKLLKSSEFQRFVHTDVKVPYRQYFPESRHTKEWKHKNCDKEKLIRCLQLIDPEVDVADNWYKPEPDDDDDTESGYQNYENMKYGIPLLSQAAEVVRSKGEFGCCQTELGTLMGVNKLCARSFCRNLVRRNVVMCVMNDVGRQRVTRFTSRKFENKGIMSLQLKQEREKMINLMSTQASASSFSSSNEDKQNFILPEGMCLIERNTENQDETITSQQLNDTASVDDSVTKDSTDVESRENSNLEISPPPCKKAKLSISKRPLEDTEEPRTEPSPKKQKFESEIEMQRNLDTIEVKLIVTKSIPGLKGYSMGFAEQLSTERCTKIIDGSKMTYRILRRANFIIEIVREVKVIADLTKLIKMIQEGEKDEGYNAKIDKKSLLRLILKLAKEGYVKYIKANLTYNDKLKTISFICDPNIDENHTVIQSAIEQAKMKFNLSGKVIENKIEKKIETEEFTYYYDRNSRKLYGYCPKFLRMRLMHELMFYLIYEEQPEPLTTQEEYKEWLEQMNIPYDNVLLSEMSPVHYKKELNWRTFLPSIPSHAEWPTGWALICDILLRVPLFLFVQCFSIMYQIDGIEYYLNHPVRKNFLVKHLPAKIRNALTYKRRYIFQMHEICTRLCYCGLVQFGPHKLKEKDQVFIYLNRNSSILNTTTSQEGYHEISSKEYDKHNYYFENCAGVDQYWYDLYSTCINTRLGGRLCVDGKYIVLEQLDTKEAMIESTQPRTPEEAVARDTGDVPGNRRGAAGLDSALFAHLRRNWNWNSNDDMCILNTKCSTETVKVHSLNNLNEYVTKHVVTGTSKYLNIIRKTPKDATKEPPAKRYKMARKTVVRKVVQKKNKIRKPFYDEIDKIALQKMAKLRTDWSPLEDHILLLCLIGSRYLCPNRHKQIISFTVIRDVLHKLVESSASKTSRACQRRILYIMKNMNTRHSVQMCLEEINQSENINKKYRHICKRIINSHVPETEMNIAFIELVSHMSTMFAKLIEPGKKIQIPNTMAKFKEKFRVCGSLRKVAPHYKDPESVNDITIATIRTVIHSSMCCSKDKTSWAYQLFKIYQQYPETLLRSVISKTRNEQMIAIKKSYMRAHKTKGSSMPLSSSPYQLSITYKHQLHTKYPYAIYEDGYNLLTNCLHWINRTDKHLSEGFEIINPLSGTAIVLMELTNKINMTYSFDIPDEIIVLDQSIQNDKYYERIITKYYNFINDPNKAELEEKSLPISQEDEQNFPHLEKKTEMTFLPRNTSTRFAFYMMRADMSEGIDEKSTQHMHDFFVVNSCRVFIHLPDLENKTDVLPEDIHEDYFLIRNQLCPEILAEIKSLAIIPDQCPTDAEIENILCEHNANDEAKSLARKILTLISESGNFGITKLEIKVLQPEKYKGNLELLEILNILTNIKIIIRTGVEKIRYVHYDHKKPWIVNSYKILRLDREKMPTVTPATKEKLTNKLYRKKSNYHAKELEKSRERLDLNSQQQVKVLMAPWIRIDGTLNRRVLDRWLGTVLITCLQQPGISLLKLSQTYTFVTPVELENLVRYLIKLKCVRQFVVKKSKTTLFSCIPTTTIVPATGFEDPKDIILEPYFDATTKYAIFIGRKVYSTDFLCA